MVDEIIPKRGSRVILQSPDVFRRDQYDILKYMSGIEKLRSFKLEHYSNNIKWTFPALTPTLR